VFLVSGVAAWVAARAVTPADGRAAIERAIGVSCAATWLPPLVIFFSKRSPWIAVIALGLATVLSRSLLLRSESYREPSGTRVPAFFIAVFFQAGLVAAVVGDWRIAAVALAIAAFVLTWVLTTRSTWARPAEPGKKARRFRVAPAFLAVTFSAGGLTPYLVHHGGSGDGGGSREPQAEEAHQEGKDGNWRSVVIGESYPGVILWPDVEEKFVTLVPPLPALSRNLFARKQVDSLSIPFYGAYWFFRGPGQPPKNSLVTHGDPSKLSFRSTDLRPLAVEARQNFGRLIDTSCCHSVEVAIRYRDRWPGTVGLELILRNTAALEKSSRSLGIQPVLSVRWSENLPAVEENIAFPMAAAAPLGQFDEVTVRFHLAPPRSDRSPKIAIRRFVFVR
jgi:hypothetical protein